MVMEMLRMERSAKPLVAAHQDGSDGNNKHTFGGCNAPPAGKIIFGAFRPGFFYTLLVA